MAIPHRLHNEVPAETAPVKGVDSDVVSDPGLSTDPDAVATHIIARYNLERRRAGEVPLDLKGMGRLRHLIAEEIERAERVKGDHGEFH